MHAIVHTHTKVQFTHISIDLKKKEEIIKQNPRLHAK